MLHIFLVMYMFRSLSLGVIVCPSRGVWWCLPQTMVGAAFLLLALVARALADGAHHGAGIKHGAGVVHNAVGHGCYPQTHYETHYRTRYQEVGLTLFYP